MTRPELYLITPAERAELQHQLFKDYVARILAQLRVIYPDATEPELEALARGEHMPPRRQQ